MWAFDNSYYRHMDGFHVPTRPDVPPEPRLIRINRPLASEMGLSLDGLDNGQLAALFSGEMIPEGAEPLAQAYAGHQFGTFVPQLGDGRAVMLGEIITPDGRRFDMQLKGAGRTPFSRGGDGKAALGPVLREYLVSEAMAALGVPTTRALAATLTGETILRDRPLTGAVLCRIAASHIRVGTFQYFIARGDTDRLRQLSDHVIARHYPALVETAAPYEALLEAVVEAQAALVARWMGLGFVHGVMNTDNMTVSGETIDYGPCAFLDAYAGQAKFSSIDQNGRYAFGAQPHMALWNLTRLAECLLPLIDADEEAAIARVTAILNRFPERFNWHWLAVMRAKTGLFEEREGDLALMQGLFAVMEGQGVDFTCFFRTLASDLAGEEQARDQFMDPTAFDPWRVQWAARMATEEGRVAERITLMNATNPRIIPRNHNVEAALEAAYAGDFTPFEALLEAVTHPFDTRPEWENYATPPDDGGAGYVTFCGT
ncbi:MAG: YdiU family protein [Sphingomonadales bacterium]|nr:YdiU family protein [Sphingomonadales bacterium]